MRIIKVIRIMCYECRKFHSVENLTVDGHLLKCPFYDYIILGTNEKELEKDENNR